MNVKLIRLITGEDIIAQIMEQGDPLILKNPVRIVVLPNKIDPKNPQVGFAPFAEFSEDKIVNIDKRHVVAIMVPIKEFVNQYTSMMSGLVVPNSNQGLILPGA